MTSPGHPLADLHYHVMKMQDILLPGVWPAQGNMSSLWAVLLIASFLWIVYRLVSVFHKPAAEIEELLGQDIPPVPEVALSSVGADSLVLYWKVPDNYHTPVKNHIHVNGINVLEHDGASPTITLSMLRPGCKYIVRAVSSNTAGFSSYSQPIHVQTIPKDGQRAARLLSVLEPGMGKRPSTGGRRVSAAPSESERETTKSPEGVSLEDTDAGDTVSMLQKQLDQLRSEDEDLQGKLEADVAENERTRAALVEDRDRLKKQHDDKEKAWHESRKHLVDLEKASKAAQRKKSKKESEVQQKKKKRQQMKEEMAGWAEKQESMQEETEKLRRDLGGVEEKHAARLAEARQAIEDAQAHGKSLEDEIREWGIKIKALEEEKRLADEREEEEEQEADRQEKEIETRYQNRLQELEVRYQEVYGYNLQVHQKLQALMQLQAAQPERFAPAPVNDYSFPNYMQPRSTRGSISRPSAVPYQQQQTPFSAAPASFGPFQTSSPSFSAAFPAFKNMDSITLDSDRARLGLTANDFDHLTGGAQMSPSADDLLPSNLLSDDPNSTLRPRGRPSVLDGMFRPEQRTSDPQSPSSQNSATHSLLLPSPPPASAAGLPKQDIDRALNNLNDAAPRRNGGLFSFTSRRSAKASSLRDPPALGTLRQGESQSFQELDDDDDNDDNDNSPRQHGHQKTISNPWSNMGNFLSRGGSAADDITVGSKDPVARKSRRLFSKFDSNDAFYGLDRTSSPRPASTYSYDQQLLRPSSESHPFPFTATDHLRLRNSPIGADWSSLGGGAYSNGHSRRQSIQHGSTSNLSLGSTPLDFDDVPANAKPAPGPIGAGRPGKTRKQKLNPGAPSFISNVFSRSESRRTPKSDKGAFDSLFDGGSRARHSIEIDPSTPGIGIDDSPPVSRLSRDGYSVMTSTTDSHDSMGGESDVTGGTGTSTSTSTQKEGFMSRLTRKSSSTKFWGGGGSKGAGGDGKKGHSHTGSISGSISRRKSTDLPATPSEADEAEDRFGSSSDYLGITRSVDNSAATTPVESSAGAGGSSKRAGLSWGKMMGKKSKKPDSTAMSETSESREEEDA